MWNLNKKAERAVKTWFLGANKKKLSAMEPKLYRNRFLNFMYKRVLTVHV